MTIPTLNAPRTDRSHRRTAGKRAGIGAVGLAAMVACAPAGPLSVASARPPDPAEAARVAGIVSARTGRRVDLPDLQIYAASDGSLIVA